MWTASGDLKQSRNVRVDLFFFFHFEAYFNCFVILEI